MTSTTYPFACLIFEMCRGAGVLIWHCDTLHSPIGPVDIVIIKDEATIAEQQREPKIEIPPMCDNFADIMKLVKGDDPVQTTLADSTHAANRVPYLSQSTCPSATMVPLAQVKILKSQMDT